MPPAGSEPGLDAALEAETFAPAVPTDAPAASDLDGQGASDASSDLGLLGPTQDGAAEASNGSTMEVGSPDAPGAFEAGVVVPCVTSGTELCDDFESGEIDPKKWTVKLGGPSPSVTVDGLHVHSGKYAAHAKVSPGQQSTAQLTESVTFPAAADTFYTRIWAFFSPDVSWPNNPPDYHTGFIIAGGNNDLGHVELAVGANLSPNSSAGAMHYLGYSIYRGPPYVEFGPRSPTPVQTMAWTCIELLESGEGGANAVRRIWVDGGELPEQQSSFGTSSPQGQKPPQFDLVSIGIWEYHPTPSLSDMWIDDVRVSHQRIGCGVQDGGP
jgi:hypothetical protein